MAKSKAKVEKSLREVVDEKKAELAEVLNSDITPAERNDVIAEIYELEREAIESEA